MDKKRLMKMVQYTIGEKAVFANLNGMLVEMGYKPVAGQSVESVLQAINDLGQRYLVNRLSIVPVWYNGKWVVELMLNDINSNFRCQLADLSITLMRCLVRCLVYHELRRIGRREEDQRLEMEQQRMLDILSGKSE